MDQLLEFFKQMSPLQLVMLAGGVVIAWPVIRDNLFKSPSSVDYIIDEEDEYEDGLDDLEGEEKMQAYWFLLISSISDITDPDEQEDVRRKLVEISSIIFK